MLLMSLEKEVEEVYPELELEEEKVWSWFSPGLVLLQILVESWFRIMEQSLLRERGRKRES